MKWPTGAPVIGGGPPVGDMRAELAGLEADRAVRVDDALGVAGGARGEGDRSPARPGRRRAGARSSVARRAGGRTATAPAGQRRSGRRRRQPQRRATRRRAARRRRRGSRCARSGRRSRRASGGDLEDVVDLLRRRRSARPARRPRPAKAAPQNVIAASTQFGSWKTTTSPGPTPRACSEPANRRAPGRPRRTSRARDASTNAQRTSGFRPSQPGRDDRAEALVGPPALGAVALDEIGGHRSEPPMSGSSRDSPPRVWILDHESPPVGVGRENPIVAARGRRRP